MLFLPWKIVQSLRKINLNWKTAIDDFNLCTFACVGEISDKKVFFSAMRNFCSEFFWERVILFKAKIAFNQNENLRGKFKIHSTIFRSSQSFIIIIWLFSDIYTLVMSYHHPEVDYSTKLWTMMHAKSAAPKSTKN